MNHDRSWQRAPLTAPVQATQQQDQVWDADQQAWNACFRGKSKSSNSYTVFTPSSSSPAQSESPVPFQPSQLGSGERQKWHQSRQRSTNLQPGGIDTQSQSYAYQSQGRYQNVLAGSYLNTDHQAPVTLQTYKKTIPTNTDDNNDTRAPTVSITAQLPMPRLSTRIHPGLGGAVPQIPRGINERMASIALGDEASMRQNQPQAYSPPELRGPQLNGIPELNILVLGETGVGKSTFINAFANYIRYGSLDDALGSRDLQCIIPSSFTWQTLVGDDYVSKTIHVSPNSGEFVEKALQDECDGTQGQSATQSTKHYTMEVNNTLVRLIDTPGIGDTRGATHDKRNMANILGSLEAVHALHGILILLKPNNARLDLMFRFCLKELLIHLHRDAAKNIVFGFTNARNTSFKPGETYTTLQRMLAEDEIVGIHLGRKISYCFDSESFRCLAAHQNNIDIHDMGDIKDYRLSWEKSAKETYRMLEHFTPHNTKPHQVSAARDLYTTRELVRILTIPMADITQNINKNIALQEDEKQELADAFEKGQDLETALHLSKVVYEIKALDMPRTVCSSAKCVEFKDGERHYKSMCHNPCYLENVEVDQFPCEALMNCTAFSNGPDRCKVCGHSWQLHLHIMWEPVEKIIYVEDQAVLLRMRQNISDRDLMQLALTMRQERIKQYEEEREIMQKAADQFAVFLKRSSIKPWNDSKLAYLDHLIEEEKGKVQAGGSKKRLRDLCADRRQHEEEIRTISQWTEAGDQNALLDQAGIKRQIEDLYSLPLTGPNLKQVAQQLENIQNTTAEKSKKGGGTGSSKRSKSRTSRTHRHGQHHGHSSGQTSSRNGESFVDTPSRQQQRQYGQQSSGDGSGKLNGYVR